MHSPIRAVIIDDDPFIHDLLRDKLDHHFPEISVVHVANSGSEGIKVIQSSQPDLVFLDVEMTDMTGFEMLSQLNDITFKTIFITSYQHYAIKAIRFNALDYLLKPFDLEELRNAIKRYKETKSDAIKTALNNLRQENASDQTLILRTQQGELELPIKDILYMEGERNYSYIHCSNGRKELVSKTLSNLEELLEDKGFFRCHKSYLVNAMSIESIKNSSLLLFDHKEIPIARRKIQLFKEWWNHGK